MHQDRDITGTPATRDDIPYPEAGNAEVRTEPVGPTTQAAPPPPTQAQVPPQAQAAIPPQQIINITQQMQAPAAIIYAQAPKSMAAALLLTFFFGPLGLFYTSTKNALIMLVVSIVAAIFTLGFSLLVTVPICMFLAASDVSKQNAMLAAAGVQINR